MPQSIDKAVITNTQAMTKKYGNPGASAIGKALQRLIASDARRGISTAIFDLSDAAQMAGVGGAPVINEKDDNGAKRAVDAIYNAHVPDYIMLLDGPDVVPHVSLHRIPGVPDGDSTTDSDLPYASSAAFGRQASAYLAVTRVVGRLPAAYGENDEKKLIALIDGAINHVPRPAAEFANYFAITAHKWKASTQMSLGALFNNHASLFVSPKDGHNGIDASFSQLSHFINCHGKFADYHFYGEQAGRFPVAVESAALGAAKVGAGSVVAAECCYGAQLYDYLSLARQAPICLTYLAKGACAVMGSTNIAYGPAASNGQADLMAQYFLEAIFAGASTGRAMLQARQKFVQSQNMSGHLNLKTLAQFLLLGDPSLHPAQRPETASAPGIEAKAMPEFAAADATSERRIRRSVLLAEGNAIASTCSRPGPRVDAPSAAVARFMAAAEAAGMKGEPMVFAVTGGADYRAAAAKTLESERQVAIIMSEEEHTDKKDGGVFTSYRAMTAHILGDGIFSIEECESR